MPETLMSVASFGSFVNPVSSNTAGFVGSPVLERQPAGLRASIRVQPENPLGALSVQVSQTPRGRWGRALLRRRSLLLGPSSTSDTLLLCLLSPASA